MRSLILVLALATPCCPLYASSTPSTAAKTLAVKPRLHLVTLINMSSQSRQACTIRGPVNLPIAHTVVLQIRIGDTVRVVSDTDPTLDERIVITEDNVRRIVTVL